MAIEAQAQFIEDATTSGYLDAQRARDLVQLFKSYQGKGLASNIEQVAVENGFITADQADSIRKLRQGRKDKSVVRQRIGNYDVLEKIGSGGMAEVFKVRDSRTGKILALKVLHRRLTEDESYLSRFFREAESAMKMQHPNIIRAFEANRTHDGLCYFAMEYVEGTTLRAWLERTKVISEREVIKMGIQVCKALAHAQEQGIVHRDIKPDNIMVTKDGRIKLTDLGLAKAHAENGANEVGMAIGTPQYISPEQARGDAAIDIRSDIYSLGATLYHAAVGQPPFTGNTAAMIMVKHVNEPPPLPRSLNPAISEALSAVLLKMLAKDPAQRYQTPKEVQGDLYGLYQILKGNQSPSMSSVLPSVGAMITASRYGSGKEGVETPAPEPSPVAAGSVAAAAPARSVRWPTRPKGKARTLFANRGKYIFLGVCISMFLCISIFTVFEPGWPRVMASALGLTQTPAEVGDETAMPVVRRVSPTEGPARSSETAQARGKTVVTSQAPAARPNTKPAASPAAPKPSTPGPVAVVTPKPAPVTTPREETPAAALPKIPVNDPKPADPKASDVRPEASARSLAAYEPLYKEYARVSELVGKGDYAQATQVIGSVKDAPGEEVELWKLGVKCVQETFARAQENLPSLVGRTLTVGPVSGPVAAVKDGKIVIKKGGAEITQPFDALTDKQKLELAGVKPDARDLNSMSQLGVLEFFRGNREGAKEKLAAISGSQNRLSHIYETVERMERMERDREIGQLVAKARNEAEKGNWNEVRDTLARLKTSQAGTALSVENVAALAAIEKRMEAESLGGALRGNARRNGPFKVEAAYDFRNVSEAWDWWHEGYWGLTGQGGLTSQGSLWLCHRMPMSSLDWVEFRFEVERVLDPVSSFVGWGIHAAAQVVIPTRISHDLPRGYYGRLNTESGSESGIWVGGEAPKMVAHSTTRSLQSGKSYTFRVTRTDEGIVWSINDEVFLKAKNLDPQPAPRLVFFAHQATLKVTGIRFSGDMKTGWLDSEKVASDFLAKALPKVQEEMSSPAGAHLFHDRQPAIWAPAPDEWRVKDNETAWASYYRAPSTRLPFQVTDGALEGKFRYPKSKTQRRGFEFTFRDTGKSRYALQFHPATSEVSLHRYTWTRDGETEETLRKSQVTDMVPDSWHSFALAFKGNRVQVNWGLATLFTYTAAEVEGGEIAIRSAGAGQNSVYLFDDLRLKLLK